MEEWHSKSFEIETGNITKSEWEKGSVSIMTKKQMETSTGMIGANNRGMSNGKEENTKEAEARAKAIKKINTVLKKDKKGGK